MIAAWDTAASPRGRPTRASADPYCTHPQAAELVRSYLNGHDAGAPFASPLLADLRGLPPVRVHVGTDEVLLDDSRRFVERAVAAGVDAHVDVWEGIVHGFLGGVGHFAASTEALEISTSFLRQCFAVPPVRRH